MRHSLKGPGPGFCINKLITWKGETIQRSLSITTYTGEMFRGSKELPCPGQPTTRVFRT